ncbi:hypothetical protein B0H34DRAFT_72531 [Crassisporium funariophilum]|nr:hypothetical protein B0H34DRAFT_72531 [Crassisporium funariophilum]
MPSFAELKAKAAGVTSAGAEKFQNVRDKHTSVPMAKTNWDPYSGAPPPPPPPPRSLVNRNTKPSFVALPPPSRTSSAGSPSLSRNNTISPAPPLPSRSSSAAPPPPPPRGKSAAPPPQPAHTSASASASQFRSPPLVSGISPPPIVRSTRPDSQPRRATPTTTSTAGTEIDWTNLSPEDKAVFFSWLDEYFANFTPPSNNKIEQAAAHPGAPSHAPPPRAAPNDETPFISQSKPASWNRPQVGSHDFTLSHPPATEHGSAALDLAHFFAPSTPWSGAWYNASGGPSIPPPLVGDSNHTFTCSWRSKGSNKTTQVGVIFADLSLFWGTVDFTTTNPEDPRQVKRHAVYLPPPKSLGQAELLEAHETYGETMALFAESFLGAGQYCARGECWDMANEALKYFAQYDYIPKPVPSISRTHGHLIFEGKATNRGREMAGRWRGGDVSVRRGDIVEWRKVKIGIKGAPPGSFYTLGDPDHTAVIVSDSIPSSSPVDGGSMKPSDLGIITVVEQSLGQLPERRDYDLSCFEEGEMWIYRPVGMKVYLGVDDITAVPPEGLHGIQQL